MNQPNRTWKLNPDRKTTNLVCNHEEKLYAFKKMKDYLTKTCRDMKRKKWTEQNAEGKYQKRTRSETY